MDKYLKLTSIFIYAISCMLTSCIGGGTHGSIEAYQYPISKYRLDSTVERVLAFNSNIQVDTFKDYYNDGDTYVTMEIKQSGMTYRYIFRYGGDTMYWNTSHNLSDLFICYAWDQDGNGGSEGNGGVSWYHWNLKQKLIKPFETELISKVDSVLNLKHVSPD